MNLNSEVEGNVAHWILFVAFCISLTASFYSLIQINSLELEELSNHAQYSVITNLDRT